MAANEQPLYDEPRAEILELEDKPGKDTPEYAELQQKFSQEVILMFQTVNDTEHKAVLSVMKPPSKSFKAPVIFPKPNMIAGKVEDWKVVLVKASAGRAVGDYVEKAMKKYPNIRFVIGVGVCYAFKQEAEKDQCKFADVLVSKAIRDNSYMKFENNEIKDLGQKINITQDLQEVFCMQAKKTLKFKVSETRKSVMHCGTFCCNTFLIKDAVVRDAFHRLNTGDIGGEMEGGELLKLQQDKKVEGIIVIKGVADYADKDKPKHWQYTAAKAAVDYIATQLRNTDEFEQRVSPTMMSPPGSVPAASPTTPVTMTSPPHHAKPASTPPRISTDSGYQDVTDHQRKPTLSEFINFPMASGKENLAVRIGTEYNNFGILLLNDDIGDYTTAAEKRLHLNAEEINKDIFKAWLHGKGRAPVSWDTLVKVLEEMRLFTLASEIKDMKCTGALQLL